MNASETSNNQSNSTETNSNDDSNPVGASGGRDETTESNQGSFECNICLDNAKDAVVSMCGHLFCWPCLNQWLEMRPNRKMCPVCKSAISKEKVVPIYGRNNTSSQDPREKLPPRPQGQRTEPENQGNFPGFGFGDGGFQMSFGIGAFPFGLFTSTFNMNDGRPQAPTPGTPQHTEEQFLSKLFLWVAILFIFWLLIA